MTETTDELLARLDDLRERAEHGHPWTQALDWDEYRHALSDNYPALRAALAEAQERAESELELRDVRMSLNAELRTLKAAEKAETKTYIKDAVCEGGTKAAIAIHNDLVSSGAIVASQKIAIELAEIIIKSVIAEILKAEQEDER